MCCENDLLNENTIKALLSLYYVCMYLRHNMYKICWRVPAIKDSLFKLHQHSVSSITTVCHLSLSYYYLIAWNSKQLKDRQYSNFLPTTVGCFEFCNTDYDMGVTSVVFNSETATNRWLVVMINILWSYHREYQTQNNCRCECLAIISLGGEP